MPTCSQAKIITNLETDIHKRLFKFTSLNNNNNNNNNNNININQNINENINDNQNTNNLNDVEITKISLLTNENTKSYQNYYNSNNRSSPKQDAQIARSNSLKKVRSAVDYTTMRIIQEHQQMFSNNSRRNSRRRISIDETPYNNAEHAQLLRKLPVLYGEYTRKESVPVNFLYNSSYRTNYRTTNTGSNQIRLNTLRSELNAKNVYSDGEDYEENTSSCSDVNNSDKSSLSLPDNISKPNNESSTYRRNSITRKSIDFNQYLPARSKRNSIEDSKAESDNIRKYNSISHNNLGGYFSYFPKLALEVETISNDIKLNNQNLNAESENAMDGQSKDTIVERKISLDQAKRLLALASIRPSKTFHKSMTEEEIEVLKKYYEIIKPKPLNHNHSNNQSDDKDKSENLIPLVYNSAKVNFSSLQNVKYFIDTYKKDIDSGLYAIDYDTTCDPKGFVLKNKIDESNVIKFPEEINDTFFALAVSSSDKDNQGLGEANLFRIVNWNDTSVLSLNTNNNHKTPKISLKNKNSTEYTVSDNNNKENKNQTKTSNLITSNPSPLSSSSPTSSTLSFEYIKNLTSLVNSVVEPKLLKQISISAVDVSVLPGGVNFEMPTFEELGINLNSLLGTNGINNGELPPIAQNGNEIQNSKLKNAAYKKLKDKVSKAKVMWFAAPPERKPFSVIFEYAGVDMEHETILDEANKYLKPIGGHVQSLEFVPRSVHLNSVYVENLWILNLNDNNTKFFTITNGLKIKDEIIPVKSYDEFIFTEYENFIRNEKYKQLIKNHEKAIERANRKNSKKSSN